MNDKTKNRVKLIMEIAGRMADKIDKERGGCWVRNRVEEIRWYPGYANSNEDEPVISANWNKIDKYNRQTGEHVLITDLFERLGLLFEKLGFHTEWSDTGTACDDCDRFIDTQPSHAWWKPQYVVQGASTICKKCFLESPEATLANLETSDEMLNVAFDFDPSKYGYEKYKEVLVGAGGPSRTTCSLAASNVYDELRTKRIYRYLVQYITVNREDKYIFWVDSAEFEEDTASEASNG